MFWGIGIEHELMMVNKNTYNIDGALLRKVLNLDIYSNENKHRIKKFINKKSNYAVFSGAPALIYKNRFGNIINQYVKNQKDKQEKYTKINLLFDKYVKLYSNNKTNSSIIGNELFKSIEEDSSINI